MKRKKNRMLCALLCLCFCFYLTGCKDTSKVRLGTGDEGGTYYEYTKRMSELMKEEFTFQLKSTAGSEANLRLIQKGFLDVAIVQDDVLTMVMEGDAKSDGDVFAGGRNYSAVAGLYTEALQIVVREDSEIRCLEELKGYRVSVGEKDSGVQRSAENLLRLAGIRENEFKRRNLSFTDAAEALREGTIDAFFCVAGAPTGAVAGLAKEMKIRILSMGEDEIRVIRKMYPDFYACTIPAGTYNGQTEEIRTVGVRAVLVAANQLDEAVVENLTKQIILNSKELNTFIVTDGALTPETAAEGISTPFHPGAAKYLKERGVDVSVEQSKGSGTVFGGQDSEGAGE